MEKYKKLLDSSVPDDIALGLALCEKEGLLQEIDYPHYFDRGVAIQFDDWTIWCSPAFDCIRIRKVGFQGNVDTGRWGGNDFDFRIKTEE